MKSKLAVLAFLILTALVGRPAQATPQTVGTIDVAGSTQPSHGLLSKSAISSGPPAIHITETTLGKLTLAFSLSASAAKPITVRPGAPDFYQRYALDLSNFTSSGAGKFQPNASFVGFRFSVEGPSWQGVVPAAIRLDNVQYALPAYYVRPGDNDKNDGHSEATAFANPQKAVDAAYPGHDGAAAFVREGTPAVSRGVYEK